MWPEGSVSGLYGPGLHPAFRLPGGSCPGEEACDSHRSKPVPGR